MARDDIPDWVRGLPPVRPAMPRAAVDPRVFDELARRRAYPVRFDMGPAGPVPDYPIRMDLGPAPYAAEAIPDWVRQMPRMEQMPRAAVDPRVFDQPRPRTRVVPETDIDPRVFAPPAAAPAQATAREIPDWVKKLPRQGVDPRVFDYPAPDVPEMPRAAVDPRVFDALAASDPAPARAPQQGATESLIDWDKTRAAMAGAKAREAAAIARGDSIAAAGARFGASGARALGQAQDLVIDPIGTGFGGVMRFLAGMTGLGSGSGGEMPKTAPKAQGAPAGKQSLVTRPDTRPLSSAQMQEMLLRNAFASPDMNVRLFKDLSGVMQKQPDAPSAKDVMYNDVHDTLRQELAMRQAEADELARVDPEKGAAAYNAATKDYTAQLIALLTNQSAIDQEMAAKLQAERD